MKPNLRILACAALLTLASSSAFADLTGVESAEANEQATACGNAKRAASRSAELNRTTEEFRTGGKVLDIRIEGCECSKYDETKARVRGAKWICYATWGLDGRS